jgi:hypothetical protein
MREGTYLFIGGEADGAKMKVEGLMNQYVVQSIPKVLSKAKSKEEDQIPLDGIQASEAAYTRRKIMVGERPLFYYGHVSLSDYECLFLLLDGYHE